MKDINWTRNLLIIHLDVNILSSSKVLAKDLRLCQNETDIELEVSLAREIDNNLTANYRDTSQKVIFLPECPHFRFYYFYAPRPYN